MPKPVRTRPPSPPRKRPASNSERAAPTPTELVIVGRIGAAHGLAGEVKITSHTQPPGNIETYRPWLIGRDGSFREVRVLALRAVGGGYLARLDGIGDRTAAQALTGLDVAVPRHVLPDLEPGREYYWRDLIGLAVVDRGGRSLGRVRRLLETGANDVLVIAPPQAAESEGTRRGADEVLIPFVEAFVDQVDLPGGRILVDWVDPSAGPAEE